MNICQYCYFNFDGRKRIPHHLKCGHLLCKACISMMNNKEIRACPFDFRPFEYQIVDNSLTQTKKFICKLHNFAIAYFCQSHYELLCNECHSFHTSCIVIKVSTEKQLHQILKTNINNFKTTKSKFVSNSSLNLFDCIKNSFELADCLLNNLDDWSSEIETPFFSRDNEKCNEVLSKYDFLNHFLIQTMKNENEVLSELIRTGNSESTELNTQFHPVLEKSIEDLPENPLIARTISREKGIEKLFNEVDINKEFERNYECLVVNESSNLIRIQEIGFGTLRDTDGQVQYSHFQINYIIMKSSQNEQVIASNLIVENKEKSMISFKIRVQPPYELGPKISNILSIQTTGLNNYVFFSQASSKIKLKLSDSIDYLGDLPILYFKTA